MTEKKFDPKKLDKLNNPDRLIEINPELIWKTLDLKAPEVLVDIGAGTGLFAEAFLNLMENGKVYACDISEILTNWMKENRAQLNQNLIVKHTGENTTGLISEKADLVYMINLHHELEEPTAMLNEAKRLLKSGGKIMIIDWKKKETKQGPPLHIRIDTEEIVAQLKSCHFEIVKSHDLLDNFCFVTAIKQ